VQNRLPAGLKGTSKCPCYFFLTSFALMQVFRGAIGAESAAGRLKGTSKCPCSFFIASFALMQVFRGAIGAESAVGWPQGHFQVPLRLFTERSRARAELGSPRGIITPPATLEWGGAAGSQCPEGIRPGS